MEASKEAIISCEFIFQGPFTWDRLQETDQEEIRYCSQCDREVYLVETEEALQAHAVQGHCVAVSFAQPKEKGEEGESIPMGVGMIKSPYGSTLRDEEDRSRSEMENGLGE